MLNKIKIRRYSADPAMRSLKTRVSTNLNQRATMKLISLEILIFPKKKRGKRKPLLIEMTDFPQRRLKK